MNDDKDSLFGSKELPKETENLIEEAELSLKKSQEHVSENDNELGKKFLDIKKNAEHINENINAQTNEISKSINIQELEIKKLQDEKILFDRNKIQSDIFENQKLLIDDYKTNNEKLKLEYRELEKKIDDLSSSNKRLLIHNAELKNTIGRFIKHNKNLQNNIDQLKKEQSDTLNYKFQNQKMINQIKFYQDDNTRLSSEIINNQKKYEIIKSNFDELESEKNNIYKQIKELNHSLTKSNIVGTHYVKEKVVEDSINSKLLNEISESNIEKEKQFSNKNTDLDNEINDIFK